jgi:hypothetical protein
MKECIKEREMMKRTIAIAIAIVACAAVAQTARAENGHNYNGSYCKAYFGGADTDVLDHTIYGIYNSSTRTRYISCPVLVDEVANTTGTTYVWVHFRANVASDTIWCSLRSMNGNGSVRQSMSASRTGTGWFRIANITNDDRWGSYAMYCRLPGRGRLNTIALAERN